MARSRNYRNLKSCRSDVLALSQSMTSPMLFIREERTLNSTRLRLAHNENGYNNAAKEACRVCLYLQHNPGIKRMATATAHAQSRSAARRASGILETRCER